jgi:hypothetical protein
MTIPAAEAFKAGADDDILFSNFILLCLACPSNVTDVATTFLSTTL